MSIDDFEVIKPISRGAFGHVYLAHKKATGDPCAIKVMQGSEFRVKRCPCSSSGVHAKVVLAAAQPSQSCMKCAVLSAAKTVMWGLLCSRGRNYGAHFPCCRSCASRS